MKIQKTIKKIVALGVGATMVGATLLGAMATDLSNYPAPFVQDGSINNAMIVVGANAATSDVIGAIDISASLQAAAYSEEEVTGTSEITVTGGELKDDLAMGTDPFAAAQEYDDGDISVLKDDEFRYDGTDYDFKEVIGFDKDTFIVQSGEEDEAYGTSYYMEVDASETLYYRWTPDAALTTNFTADDKLEISFLGQDLTITAVSGDSVTLSTSVEEWRDSGEEFTVTVAGMEYTISIDAVYSDTDTMISVNGESQLLSETDVEDWDYDNFELEILQVVNDEGSANDIVKLAYGTTASETATSGDSSDFLGVDSDDSDEAEWVWDINSTTNIVNWIGVKYNQNRNEIGSDLNYDYSLPSLAEGESISFPNDYAQIQFAKVSNIDREEFTVTADSTSGFSWKNDDDVQVFIDEDILKFEATTEIFVVGGSEYEKVYVGKNLSKGIGLVDSSGAKTNVSWSSTAIKIKVDDESRPVVMLNTTGGSNATGTLGFVRFDNISGAGGTDALNWTLDWTEDEALGPDVTLGSSGIGTRDYAFSTDYGVLISAIEDGIDDKDSEVLTLAYPQEAATFDLAIGAESTTSTTGVTSQSINWIGLGLGALDSDVSSDAGNLIVVGGPCANSVAAELMGSTSDNCADGFSEGQAKIKLYDTGDNMALLVAGYSAMDTRAASRAVANYASEDFSGDELAVTVLSATDYSLGAPAAEEEEPEADATEDGE